jgi:hypothetical protein
MTDRAGLTIFNAHIQSMPMIRSSFFIALVCVSCFSCNSGQELNDCKGWNLVKLYREGEETTVYKKKHVVLFAANGYFNAMFWRQDQQKFMHINVSSDIVLTAEQEKAAHQWQWGDDREVIVAGNTAYIERISNDTLILTGYPVENGRAIYVRKTDLSDVSLDEVDVPSHYEVPIE